MDDALFHKRADAALEDLFDALNVAADDHGFEADFNTGALTIEFDDPPAKFVVSPNSPVSQIWISANVRSYKLSWDEGAGVFSLEGRPLRQVVAAAITEHLGESVHL
ncbi:MAG: iron donor protein CyaY [Bryobacteraceae bacterium]